MLCVYELNTLLFFAPIDIARTHWQQHQNSWLDWIIKNSTPPPPAAPAAPSQTLNRRTFSSSSSFSSSFCCWLVHSERRRLYINGRLKEDEAITNHDRYKMCTLYTLHTICRLRDIQSEHIEIKKDIYYIYQLLVIFWFYFEWWINVCDSDFAWGVVKIKFMTPKQFTAGLE